MARKRLEMETQRLDASELARAARAMDAHVRDQPTQPPPTTAEGAQGPATADRTSEVRLAPSHEDDPWLDRVPVVTASEGDLAWFGTDVGAQAILSLIDGVASVRVILTKAPMARDHTVTVLRELETHQVIAIQ